MEISLTMTVLSWIIEEKQLHFKALYF